MVVATKAPPAREREPNHGAGSPSVARRVPWGTPCVGSFLAAENRLVHQRVRAVGRLDGHAVGANALCLDDTLVAAAGKSERDASAECAESGSARVSAAIQHGQDVIPASGGSGSGPLDSWHRIRALVLLGRLRGRSGRNDPDVGANRGEARSPDRSTARIARPPEERRDEHPDERQPAMLAAKQACLRAWLPGEGRTWYPGMRPVRRWPVLPLRGRAGRRACSTGACVCPPWRWSGVDRGVPAAR